MEVRHPPIRAALVRFWTRYKILRMPVPLTAAAALRAESSFELSAWLPAFLRALAGEAADGRQLLMDLERAWFAARTTGVAGRRRNSHAAAAVDVLAATPLISATRLPPASASRSRVPSGCWTAWPPPVSPSRSPGVEAATVRAQGHGTTRRGRPTALPARAGPRAGPASAGHRGAPAGNTATATTVTYAD